MSRFMKIKNEDNTRKKARRNGFTWNINKLFVISIIFLVVAVGIRVLNFNNEINTEMDISDFEDEEVMTVNNQKIVMNEFLLYAADVYQGYNLQNEADWEAEVTDINHNVVTFEDQVKGTICEQIRMTKVLCMKAQAEGIILSEDERKILLDNANTYYADLTKANAINESLTIELIAKFYEENALAQKVYNSILNGYELNQTESTVKSDESANSELTDKELYFIEIYHDLADGYDKNYDYETSINWKLLKLLSFSELSKEDNGNPGTVSDNKKVKNGLVKDDKPTTSDIE